LEFRADEALYRRVHPRNIDPNNPDIVLPGAIPFPKFSVDRQRFRVSPYDTIRPEDDPRIRILAFAYGDLPRGPFHNPDPATGYECTFGVEYTPTENNQSHCDVVAYRNGENVPDDMRFPSSGIRNEFRALLQRVANLLPMAG
jgi:hypothetical protein